MRINLFIFIYCGLLVLILVVFVLFLLSLRFGQISPLAFFRWFTATSDRNAESCKVAINHLKKARGEIWPKRSERRNNTKTTMMRTKSPQWKQTTLILRLRSLISKWFELKTITIYISKFHCRHKYFFKLSIIIGYEIFRFYISYLYKVKWFHVFLSNSIWSIDRTWTGINTPSQGGYGSNGNEEVIFRTGSSLSVAV